MQTQGAIHNRPLILFQLADPEDVVAAVVPAGPAVREDCCCVQEVVGPGITDVAGFCEEMEAE